MLYLQLMTRDDYPIQGEYDIVNILHESRRKKRVRIMVVCHRCYVRDV